MLEALKSLFENNAISEEIRAEIEDAWTQKVEENKLSVTAELRSEFAEKYEHDKANLTDAVDKMVSERIEAEMQELAADKKALAEERVKYATHKLVSILANLRHLFLTGYNLKFLNYIQTKKLWRKTSRNLKSLL